MARMKPRIRRVLARKPVAGPLAAVPFDAVRPQVRVYLQNLLVRVQAGEEVP